MFEEELNIPKNHKLVETKKSEWKQKRGQDTDTYWFDELNSEGEVVARYIVKDSTSMYPPFKRNITYEKINIEDSND